MADELDKKLKQIADMFGVSDTKQLKDIVETLVPPEGSSKRAISQPEQSINTDDNPGYPTPTPSNYQYSGPDINFLTKAGEMLSRFNYIQDSRITLLNSVQPFLRAQRKQRLNGAIQLLRVIAVLNSLAPTNRDTKG